MKAQSALMAVLLMAGCSAGDTADHSKLLEGQRLTEWLNDARELDELLGGAHYRELREQMAAIDPNGEARLKRLEKWLDREEQRQQGGKSPDGSQAHRSAGDRWIDEFEKQPDSVYRSFEIYMWSIGLGDDLQSYLRAREKAGSPLPGPEAFALVKRIGALSLATSDHLGELLRRADRRAGIEIKAP